MAHARSIGLHGTMPAPSVWLRLSFLNWLAVAELHEVTLARAEDDQACLGDLEGRDQARGRHNQGQRTPTGMSGLHQLIIQQVCPGLP